MFFFWLSLNYAKDIQRNEHDYSKKARFTQTSPHFSNLQQNQSPMLQGRS